MHGRRDGTKLGAMKRDREERSVRVRARDVAEDTLVVTLALFWHEDHFVSGRAHAE